MEVQLEIFQKKLEGPNFETIIDETDMRTLFFYVTLFALVGGIDHVGIIKMIAGAMAPYIQSNLIVGTTIVYWVTAPIVGIVEQNQHTGMLFVPIEIELLSNERISLGNYQLGG